MTLVPSVVPVTLTENEHVLGEGMLMPESVMLPLPAVAVTEPMALAPPLKYEQVIADCPLGVATTSPAGKASVKPNEPVLLLATLFKDKLKVRLVDPFSSMLEAPNDLVKVNVDGVPANAAEAPSKRHNVPTRCTIRRKNVVIRTPWRCNAARVRDAETAFLQVYWNRVCTPQKN